MKELRILFGKSILVYKSIQAVLSKLLGLVNVNKSIIRFKTV